MGIKANLIGTSKYIAIAILLVITTSGFSQEIVPTKGKEFWVGFLENWAQGGSAESLDLFITSDVNTSGTVTIPQQGWTLDFDVIANQTTTVNIPNNIGENIENQIIDDKGILVETADTVAVFAINMEQYTADGTKILPTKSLATEYMLVSYFGLTSPGSEFMIVATEDDTEVIITPSVSTLGGDVAGVPFNVQLDRGETYQVQTGETDGDFTGTTIIATEESGECRPFAVFSGSYCSNIPSGCTACDHIYDQNFPVAFWGNEYFTCPFNYTTSYTYKIAASQDATSIFIDGAFEGTLNAGEHFEYNSVADPHCIEGDKPIAVVQFMEGINCAGQGDPAMLFLNDKSQKIDNITFSTVSSTIITQHSVSMIIASDATGSVTLDGGLLDPAIFTPIPSCPDHSYSQFDITEGSHTLESPDGFTAYIYGNGFAESYAYSAGSFISLDQIVLEVDSVICSGNEIILQTDASLFDIVWYTQTNPEDTIGTGPILVLEPPIVTDIYVAAGSLLISGCESEQLFLVETPDPPIVDAQTENVIICQYESVQLSVDVLPASDIYEYTWTPAAGLDDPNSPTPIATPLETTTYTVLVATPTGCSAAESDVTIEVIPGNLAGLDATTDDDLLCNGEQAQLDLTIEEVIYDDNFDPGVSWGLWCDITNGFESTDCGSVSGNALYFNGVGERSASTNAVDVSDGGTLSFTIKFGTGVFPCDDTEPGESVSLEYSTGGCGGPYTQIMILSESAYPEFETVNVDIPVGAQTAATHFKWRQISNSGADQDNWSLDDVYVASVTTTTYEYLWTPDASLDDNTVVNPIASPDADITYYVELTDVGTGCSYTDSIFIAVGQPFTVDITPDTVLCDIQGIELQATPSGIGNYSFSWSPADGSLSSVFSDSPTASPIATTEYTVAVTSEEGCEASASVTITVNQLLALDVTTDNDDFCQGEVANLAANIDGDPTNLEFAWTPAQYLDDATSQFPVATPPGDTTFEVIVTDTESGCSLSESISLTVFQTFSISSIVDTLVCSAIGLELTTTENSADPLTWSWTPAANLNNAGSQSPVVNVDVSQEYIVTATDLGGCTQKDTVMVEVIFDTFDLGETIPLCLGENVTISTGYGVGFDHLWSTNETTSSITVEDPGLVSVVVTGPGGCEREDEVEVVVYDLPVVNIGDNQAACENEVIVLNAGNAGSDFQWSTTAISQSIDVTESGQYWVLVTDDIGCMNGDTVTIVFNNLPIVTLPDTLRICEDEFAVFNAGNSGSFFEWSNDATTQTISVNEPGTYGVTVTNIYNCSAQAQGYVDVYYYPEVDLGPDISLCFGEGVLLDAGNPDLNILWSTGAETQTIGVSSSNFYSVEVDNGYCFSSDEVSVIFHPLPVDALGPDTTICFTSVPSHMLHAGNDGYIWVWQDGTTSQTYQIHDPGYFTVNVITPFGCQDNFDVLVEELCPGQLYIPNSFSPNNDGINDAFFAIGKFILEFNMQVWNRWGDKIFETDDIHTPWDGSVDGGGYYVENEVYLYVITYRYLLDEDGTPSDKEQIIGHITVIR